MRKEWTELMGPGHKLLKCPAQSTKPRADPQSGVTPRTPGPGDWRGLVLAVTVIYTELLCTGLYSGAGEHVTRCFLAETP